VSFLIDTNVISETARPSPDHGVVSWLAATDEDEVFLSVATLAELRRGVERLAVGARRARLDAWLAGDLPTRFEGRILSIDVETADVWGRFVAAGEAMGRPIGATDAFIAATAKRHRLTLVTRDTSDFEATGLRLFNPWTGGSSGS
jgi:predicted nucleic acid-binding protein